MQPHLNKCCFICYSFFYPSFLNMKPIKAKQDNSEQRHLRKDIKIQIISLKTSSFYSQKAREHSPPVQTWEPRQGTCRFTARKVSLKRPVIIAEKNHHHCLGIFKNHLAGVRSIYGWRFQQWKRWTFSTLSVTKNTKRLVGEKSKCRFQDPSMASCPRKTFAVPGCLSWGLFYTSERKYMEEKGHLMFVQHSHSIPGLGGDLIAEGIHWFQHLDNDLEVSLGDPMILVSMFYTVI